MLLSLVNGFIFSFFQSIFSSWESRMPSITNCYSGMRDQNLKPHNIITHSFDKLLFISMDIPLRLFIKSIPDPNFRVMALATFKIGVMNRIAVNPEFTCRWIC